MKWNKYRITTKRGTVIDVHMGEWLKPGDYDFGKVEIIHALTDDEVSEYKQVETELMKVWIETVSIEN